MEGSCRLVSCTVGSAFATAGRALATEGSALATDGSELATDGSALASVGSALATAGRSLATTGRSISPKPTPTFARLMAGRMPGAVGGGPAFALAELVAVIVAGSPTLAGDGRSACPATAGRCASASAGKSAFGPKPIVCFTAGFFTT